MKFKPVRYIKNQLIEALNSQSLNQNSVPELLLQKSLRESAEFADTNMKEAMMFFDHAGIWNYCCTKIKQSKLEGHLLEFGVFQGNSINFISQRCPDFKFYGFDSFEGLKEDWKGWSLTKGAFDLKGKMPAVNSNVKLVKGWFDETIPTFIKENKIESLKWLHIDSDTYDAAKTIFDNLKQFIKPGTLILFDEFFGYRGWEIGEFKAFNEFIAETSSRYNYLAFSKCQVLVEIL